MSENNGGAPQKPGLEAGKGCGCNGDCRNCRCKEDKGEKTARD
ncbi:hypothetical protein Deba_1261 [Desulfarculus baarsii DSM 2075]|uniref:Uncharacterized protein n=1 Tax=Desulfarculus baarsii (strain ATCC 33931 / DSM 2075 / LMG 7858 / VKM B-1802 / 2st14) TaxID=644282 RepID=E1QG19_DESB2|nr:hypothetical protein [Desulfarculus baarsii]ADK84629.1 hypothetical protein Deba_1261 [Desulfarculus baarsii DSM 2075]